MSKKFEAKCKSLNNFGYGIIESNKTKIEVPYFLPKEKGIVEIIDSEKYRRYKLDKLITVSPERAEPQCKIYQKCGSCQLLHMKYNAQVEFKKDYVASCFKENKLNIKINDVITADNNGYRNKMQVGYRLKNGEIVYGFYEEDTHRIVSLTSCPIHSDKQNNVAGVIARVMKELHIQPYNEDKKTGLIRYALIREALDTKQILVAIVTGSEQFPGKNDFVKKLLKYCPFITTIVQNINTRKTSIVLGDKEKILYGNGDIEEKLCGLRFKLSSSTFFQVNPVQTEKLYQKVKELAEFKGSEVIIDAYCGVGTIGMVLSNQVKYVIGVESNKKSVINARINAQNNKINNIRFINDDATNYMQQLANSKEKIDAVVIDPPRSGATEQFLTSLMRLNPEKVIYVSCDPKTLARDIKMLAPSYAVKQVVLVDLFVGTYHIETICLLTRDKI